MNDDSLDALSYMTAWHKKYETKPTVAYFDLSDLRPKRYKYKPTDVVEDVEFEEVKRIKCPHFTCDFYDHKFKGCSQTFCQQGT